MTTACIEHPHETLERIDELKQYFDIYPLSANTERSFADDFRLQCTYASTQLDGNSFSVNEIETVLDGMAVGGKTLKEHFEVMNHHQAMLWIERQVRQSKPLNENLMTTLYRILMQHIHDQGKVLYRNEIGQPETDDIQKSLQALIDEHHQSEEHPIIRATALHQAFYRLSPFPYYNACVARLLLNFSLMSASYPAIIIHENQKDAYQSALSDDEAMENLVMNNVMKSLSDKMFLAQGM
ncbi:MAG: Fic family protein [Neisseriaceae bacterium]|nr:Fic family protein [Neisseriaceae bacterium]